MEINKLPYQWAQITQSGKINTSLPIDSVTKNPDLSSTQLQPALVGVGNAASSDNTSSLNIDELIERIANGDISALEELDKFKISYTQAENNYGGTIIKFQYEGIKYTVTCYPSSSSNNNGNNNTNGTNGTSGNNGTNNIPQGQINNTVTGSNITKNPDLSSAPTQPVLVGGSSNGTSGNIGTSVVGNVNKDPNPSDFSSFNDLDQYALSQGCKDSLAEIIPLETIEALGGRYNDIVRNALEDHVEDFSTISKADVVNEIANAIIADSAVNTFKSNYATFGLSSSPTAEEIEKFEEILNNILSNKDSLENIGETDDSFNEFVQSLVTSASETIAANRESLKQKVDNYINIWVNDFKTGYTRWGLKTPPSEDEISFFRDELTKACNNNITSLPDDSSEADVKAWVRNLCNSIRDEILATRNTNGSNGASGTGNVNKDPNPSDFSSFNDLDQYALSQGCKDSLAEIIPLETIEALGGRYNDIVRNALEDHVEDFSTISKADVVNEIANAIIADSAVNTFKSNYATFGLSSSPTAEEIEKFEEILNNILSNKDSLENIGETDDSFNEFVQSLVTSASETIAANRESLKQKVDNYINIWVNDFKTGYTRWGLKTPPSEDEISFFRDELTKACNNNITSLPDDSSEADVKAWVRNLCNSVRDEILAARNTSGSNGTSGTDGTNSGDKVGDFTEYYQLYLYAMDCEEEVLARLGLTAEEFKANCGKSYDVIKHYVATSHEKDFASVTKEQLINEIIATYNSYANIENPEDSKVETPEDVKDENSQNYKEIVDSYIKFWTADFETNYSNWGLDTPPTAEEISLFSSRVSELCYTNINIIGEIITSEEDIKNWVEVYGKNIVQEIISNRNKVPDYSVPGSADYTALTQDILKALEKSNMKDIGKIINGHENIHTEFGMDNNGNIVFQEQSTTDVYNALYNSIKTRISELENGSEILQELGGEDALKKLVQNAWISTYSDFNSSQSNNTTQFVKKVYENLEKMMNSIAKNSNNLILYTQRNSYADPTLTDGLIHYNTNTTYCNDQIVNYGNGYIDNGVVNLKDSNDNTDYHTTMDALLYRLKQKYTHLDENTISDIFKKAQVDAISILTSKANDCPYGTGNNAGRVGDFTKDWSGLDNRLDDNNEIYMGELVDLVLYCFDKELLQNINNNSINASSTENSYANQTDPSDSTNPTTNAAENLEQLIPEIKNKNLAEIIGNNSTIHTEFGINSVNGNIVFQEQSTTLVFNRLCSVVDRQLQSICDPTLYSQFGGSATVNKLVQAAWITTYNSYDSSQSNNTAAFVSKALDNLQKIMQALQKDPNLIEIFTRETSYADSTLTEDLIHYGTNTTYGSDENVSYSGEVKVSEDGTIHLSNELDDSDYQSTMTSLIYSIKEKYPELDSNLITSVFQSAQKEAILALQNNKFDCPYGTANNDGRVEDSNKNWTGLDNRDNDSDFIAMDQLVQMTLYYFDKLLYQRLVS